MDKVTAFDALFTNNKIQKLKILISYLDSPLQQQLAIYIKFLELKYTMDLFRSHPELSVSPTQQNPPEPAQMLQEISPYCNNQEQKQLNQLLSMLQAMNHYQEIMDMMQMFQEMFPDGMPFPGGDTSMDFEGSSTAGDSTSVSLEGSSAAGDGTSMGLEGSSTSDDGTSVYSDESIATGDGTTEHTGEDGSRKDASFFGNNSDMMAAGLGNLFGGNMPDISQLRSMMNMLQSMNSSPVDPTTENS